MKIIRPSTLNFYKILNLFFDICLTYMCSFLSSFRSKSDSDVQFLKYVVVYQKLQNKYFLQKKMFAWFVVFCND